MAVTSYTLPGTASGWTDSDYIKVGDDDNYAYDDVATKANTAILLASNFGFSLPGGSIIDGIEAQIRRLSLLHASAYDEKVRLLKAGSEIGSNYAITYTAWDGSATTAGPYPAAGGSTNLWGTTWTQAEIEASGFGVAIQAYNDAFTDNTARVYWVKIRVYYHVGDPATVTTQACDDLEETTATANGNITDVGMANATRRGFCYMEGDSGDPTTANSTAYDDGDYGTGAFDKGLTGLAGGTNYRVRAYAVTIVGTAYGATVQLLTKPAAPTNVAASGDDNAKVVITWTKSSTATGYRVYQDDVDVSGLLGDVATYDDTDADIPVITPGTAVAGDGASSVHVSLSLSGESVANGTTHTYKVTAANASGVSSDSDTDTGWRLADSLTYQWQRSAAASDADYSDIDGATTEAHDDTEAPASGAVRYFKCIENSTSATEKTSAVNDGYRAVGIPTDVAASGDDSEKVVITWTKSSGATAYQVYRDDVGLGWLGDVATHDDEDADAPVITPGTAVASDGTYSTYVYVSIAGESIANGTTHTYKVRAKSAVRESADSSTDTGFKLAGTLTYQWQRSITDEDIGHVNIDGATTEAYQDTEAPS